MAVEDLNSEGQNVAAADRALRGTLPGVLVKHTGDAHAVEDVLHDVMPKLLASEKADRTESDNLGGWLYTVGRNVAKPVVSAARSLSNSAAGIDSTDAPLFNLAGLMGAAGATLLFGWFAQGDRLPAAQVILP